MSRADFVVHFAAESHVARSICDDTTFFETDVMGTRVMMTALVKHRNTVSRYIHISTSEVCGTAVSIPMDEEHPINPRSPYAAAKAGADRLVYAYWCTFSVPAVIFRPFNNYGPRQHLEKMIPRFITSAIKGERLTIHGDGHQKRDWVHTYDLARALDMALHMNDFHKIKNQVIHIGSGVATPVLDIAKTILDYFNLPHETYLKFIGDRPGQVQGQLSSTEKSLSTLGWEAKISLEQGLSETIGWYLDNEAYWQQMDGTQYVPIYTNDDVIEMQ